MPRQHRGVSCCCGPLISITVCALAIRELAFVSFLRLGLSGRGCCLEYGVAGHQGPSDAGGFVGYGDGDDPGRLALLEMAYPLTGR